MFHYETRYYEIFTTNTVHVFCQPNIYIVLNRNLVKDSYLETENDASFNIRPLILSSLDLSVCSIDNGDPPFIDINGFEAHEIQIITVTGILATIY